MRTIDMKDYLTKGIGLLAGRDRGTAVRESAGIAKLDAGTENVLVTFPSFVYSINSSFFLGVFEVSIDDLGEVRFGKKYQFDGPLAQKACKDALRAYRIYRRPLRDSGGE